MKQLKSKIVLGCCLSGLMVLSSTVTAATLTYSADGVFSSAIGTGYQGLGTNRLLWTQPGNTISALAYYSNRIGPLPGLYPEGSNIYAGHFEFINGNATQLVTNLTFKYTVNEYEDGLLATNTVWDIPIKINTGSGDEPDQVCFTAIGGNTKCKIQADDTTARFDIYFAVTRSSGTSSSSSLLGGASALAESAIGDILTFEVSDIVHVSGDGEVITYPAAVPVPPAIWLFGSGLLGLVGVSRRKKTA